MTTPESGSNSQSLVRLGRWHGQFIGAHDVLTVIWWIRSAYHWLPSSVDFLANVVLAVILCWWAIDDSVARGWRGVGLLLRHAVAGYVVWFGTMMATSQPVRRVARRRHRAALA